MSDLEKAVRYSNKLNRLGAENYFSDLVKLLAELLESDIAFVCEIDSGASVAKTVSVCDSGELAENFSYDLNGTPCQDLTQRGFCCFNEGLLQLYPNDQLLIDLGIEAYLGKVLTDRRGDVIGLMVTLYKRPFKSAETLKAVFEVFEDRAACELERMRYETRLNEQIAELTRKNDELQLAQSVFQNTSEGIFVTDAECRISSVNPAFTRITGYSADEVMGENPRILSSGRHDNAYYKQMWNGILGTVSWQGEMWNRRKNGEIHPVLQSITAVRDGENRITKYVSSFTDTSELREMQSRIEHLAHHDALTGLPNRTLFASHLDRALADALRDESKLAVLLLDVDRFKLINDTLGHAAGDELLTEVGKRVREAVRHGDTVSRQGGDEFAIILRDLKSVQHAVQISEKIIDAIAQPIAISSKKIVTSASVGISVFPDDAASASDLVRAADTAMYRAKKNGRNTYSLYTAELGKHISEKLSLETDLRRALDQNEFELFFQPFVDLGNGRITGFESLLRWNHPRRGVVMPDEFIHIAEESDLIDRVGKMALDEALSQAIVWKNAGLHLDRIAVNVSGRQVLYDNLAESVAAALERQNHELHPVTLELEITESVLLSMDRSKNVLESLKASGVRIGIDDFGTGFSSLSRLQSLPVDTLKIDRSFLRRAPEHKDSAALVAAIIAMGKSLGLRVIAEGVERESQIRFLNEQNCDEAQGYLLSRPLGAIAAGQLLEKARLSLPGMAMAVERSKQTMRDTKGHAF